MELSAEEKSVQEVAQMLLCSDGDVRGTVAAVAQEADDAAADGT